MEGVNKAIVMGTVGKDAQVTFLENGGAVGKFSIATNGAFKKKDGTKQEYTDWHNIEVWNETAKWAATWVKKGTNIYIEGEMKTDKYKDKDGKDAYSFKIKALTVKLLPNGGGKPADAQETSASIPVSTPASTPAPANHAAAQAHEYVNATPGNASFADNGGDDDLPF